MKTFTQSITELKAITQNNTTENDTNLKIWLNQSWRVISSIRNGKWKWLEKTYTVSTVASQQAYQIPNRLRKTTDIYVTVGTTIYIPEKVYDPIRWSVILQSQLGTSDVPRFVYIENDTAYLSPIPATSGNTITFRGRLDLRDLAIADYTTGTITAIASGATTVTGSGTSWTTSMAGRYIQITETNGAGGGDGFWYEIASVTNTTTLVLLKPYQGTTIAAGTAAYTIGQVPPIPEAYQDAPLFRTQALYWTQHGKLDRAATYWRLYDGGKEAGIAQDYGGLIGAMIEESGATVEGPYISPNDYSRFDPNNPEQRGSGF